MCVCVCVEREKEMDGWIDGWMKERTEKVMFGKRITGKHPYRLQPRPPRFDW